VQYELGRDGVDVFRVQHELARVPDPPEQLVVLAPDLLHVRQVVALVDVVEQRPLLPPNFPPLRVRLLLLELGQFRRRYLVLVLVFLVVIRHYLCFFFFVVVVDSCALLLLLSTFLALHVAVVLGAALLVGRTAGSRGRFVFFFFVRAILFLLGSFDGDVVFFFSFDVRRRRHRFFVICLIVGNGYTVSSRRLGDETAKRN